MSETDEFEIEEFEPADAVQYAIHLANELLAEAVQTKFDEVAPEMDALITGETAEAIIEELVEGDTIIDDGRIHAMFRKILDEHRQRIANINEQAAAYLNSWATMHAAGQQAGQE